MDFLCTLWLYSSVKVINYLIMLIIQVCIVRLSMSVHSERGSCEPSKIDYMNIYMNVHEILKSI